MDKMFEYDGEFAIPIITDEMRMRHQRKENDETVEVLDSGKIKASGSNIYDTVKIPELEEYEVFLYGVLQSSPSSSPSSSYFWKD